MNYNCVRIVLTGGPGGGEATRMRELQNENRGHE
jgi:predicted ATPase